MTNDANMHIYNICHYAECDHRGNAEGRGYVHGSRSFYLVRKYKCEQEDCNGEVIILRLPENMHRKLVCISTSTYVCSTRHCVCISMHTI